MKLTRFQIHPLEMVLVLFFTFSLSSCGSFHQNFYYEYGVTGLPHAPIEIGPFTNDSRSEIQFDFKTYFRDALKQELYKAAIASIEGSAPGEAIVLNFSITEYAAGNAFKRWLFPGWGSTVLGMQVGLFQKKDAQKKLGTIRIRRSVDLGGAYTIGAYKTVFKEAAQAIVEQLSKMQR